MAEYQSLQAKGMRLKWQFNIPEVITVGPIRGQFLAQLIVKLIV